MARRHRVLKVVVLVVGTLIALVAIGAGLQPDDGTFLVEDFESDESQFSTDSDRLVDLTVEDGAYRIAIKDPTAPQIARIVFQSARHAIRFEADVSGEGEGGWGAGVGCWAGDSAYVFMMADTGDVLLMETLSDSTGERQFITEPTTVDSIVGSTEPVRLRIDCIAGGTDPTIVQGWVNGQPVVSVADPDGYDSFMAIGIFAFAEEAGTEFRVDNVIGAEDPTGSAVSPVVLPTGQDTVQRSKVDVSATCDAVFADAKESSDAGLYDLAEATIGMGAPQECATMDEAAAASAGYFGAGGTGELENYLSRACVHPGWSADIRETDLCRELLASHPELT